MDNCTPYAGDLEACAPAPDNGRLEKQIKFLKLLDDPFINFLLSQKVDFTSMVICGGNKKFWQDRYGYRYEYSVEFIGGKPRQTSFIEGKYYFNSKKNSTELYKQAGF